MLNNNGRAKVKILLPTPSFGAAKTSKYVMPNSGIKTSNAFDALRYCRVSAVFAERSFVMSTWIFPIVFILFLLFCFFLFCGGHAKM